MKVTEEMVEIQTQIMVVTVVLFTFWRPCRGNSQSTAGDVDIVGGEAVSGSGGMTFFGSGKVPNIKRFYFNLHT